MGITQQDLAFMVNKLEVPMVVSDILAGDAKLDDDNHYALHDALSSLQPDSALIAITLSIQSIIEHASTTNPVLKPLQFECQRIVHDYGSLWTQNAKYGYADPEGIFDVLIHTAEDLETIAAFIGMYKSSIELQDPALAELCQILVVQANAQSLVAESFIMAADMQVADSGSKVLPILDTGYEAQSNVIPFRH